MKDIMALYLNKSTCFISILKQCVRRVQAKKFLKKNFLKYLKLKLYKKRIIGAIKCLKKYLKLKLYKKRIIGATECLKKYLQLRLYRKRVKASYLCRLFNYHYIDYPLHTLIPYEELNSYLSQELKAKYRRMEAFSRYWEEDEEQVAPPPPTYYSGRYFTQEQIDDGAFVYSGRNVTCRYTGMDYCGLFGLGPRGHAYNSCIGWCGSRHDPENEKCHRVETREAIMKIILVIKRWARNKILRKKRIIPIQKLYKELYENYYSKRTGQPLTRGKLAAQVLFNSRFAKSHIMKFL